MHVSIHLFSAAGLHASCVASDAFVYIPVCQSCHYCCAATVVTTFYYEVQGTDAIAPSLSQRPQQSSGRVVSAFHKAIGSPAAVPVAQHQHQCTSKALPGGGCWQFLSPTRALPGGACCAAPSMLVLEISGLTAD